MTRPIIQAFAEAMEAKLAANDHKPEWLGQHLSELLIALRGEMSELTDVLYDVVPDENGRAALLSEACDVALYALMVADCCGTLPPTTDRGRQAVESVEVE